MSRLAFIMPEDDDEFGPDLLSDPTFVPCRDDSCPRPGLHPAHEVAVRRRSSRDLSQCPECQAPVVVTQTKRKKLSKSKRTRQVITAECPACGWKFSNARRGN